MHTVIDQLVPPNVINYSRKFSAITSSLPGIRQEFLACVKTNFIDVYTVDTEKGLMKLFSKHTFAARIESIEVLCKQEQDSDWIFLTFSDCKMTVFEYNGLINDFVPRSFHFFERESFRTSVILGTATNLCPIISLDPEGRMAAVRVFSSHLALISLSENLHEHEQEHNTLKAPSTSNSIQSHVINFAFQIDARLKVVKNLIFLPGFLNPTVAILYDRGSNEGESNDNNSSLPLRTSLNHSDTTYPKETCAIMIVAIEPVLKYRSNRLNYSDPSAAGAFQFTVVNCIEGVPFDAEGLHALPKPVGGLFISCNNLLLWCDISSSTAPYSIALNQFAPLTYSGRISISQFQSLNLCSLLDCRLIPLIPSSGNVLKCLILTKHGEKLLVSIARTGRTLGFFNIERLESGAKISPCPSDIIQWDEDHIFVSSEGGGSQLLSLYANEIDKSEDDKPAPPTSRKETSSLSAAVPLNDDIDAFLYGEDVEMAVVPPLKKFKEDVKISKNEHLPDDDYLLSLENDELAKPSKPSASQSQKSLSKSKQKQLQVQLELIDELESLGPVIDLAVGSNEVGSTELVTVGGAFTDTKGQFHPGSLNVMTQRIPPSIQLSFSLPETRKIWTINGTGENETKYLVASSHSSTLVLTTSQARIVELEESDFYLEGPTLFCSNFTDALILQVYPSGMKLLKLRDASLFKEIQADFNSLSKVFVTETSIFILFNDGILKEFTNSLKIKHEISNVSAFTTDGEFLFIAKTDGMLEIYKGASAIFENQFFSRLPITLTNRPVIGDSPQIDLISQKIISLSVLQSSILVVRYESQKSIGLVSYLLNSFNVLQRITSESLGGIRTISSTDSFDSVKIENELILTCSNPNLPIYSFGLNSRNFPRLHLLFPNEIISMASYNQTSLMLLKESGHILIVDLHKMRKRFDLNWQSGWYLRRVPLDVDRVPTHVTFHPPSKTYLVASAELSTDFVLPIDEYGPISENPNATPYVGPVPKIFGASSNALHLLNPISWTVVDAITENFLPYEGVTCIRCLELETRQTASGFSPFLTVGTAYQKGEDRPIRGRALVFDVAEVVPEPGKPETNRKLRLKGITDFKGPVMAMTSLRQGHVVISAGAKVIVNNFEEDEKFAGVAFQDIGTCTLSIASLKSFFVTADLVNSIAFLAFQAEPLARIHEIGRDFGQNLQCTAVEFVVNSHGQVMIVVSDDQGGLHFFSYAPNNLTTNSGQRLLDKGSFYLHGAPVTRLYRIPVPNSFGDLGVLIAGQDGSIHFIAPLEDSATFRRLFMLEIRLGTVLPGSGGLVSRVTRQVPKRMTVSHAMPATTTQYTVTLPTSAIQINEDNSDYTSNAPNPHINNQSESFNPVNISAYNSTIILHHLPVSNSLIDAQAIKRLHSDPLCDGLARQIFANRFGVDFETLMSDVSSIYSKFYI